MRRGLSGPRHFPYAGQMASLGITSNSVTKNKSTHGGKRAKAGAKVTVGSKPRCLYLTDDEVAGLDAEAQRRKSNRSRIVGEFGLSLEP